MSLVENDRIVVWQHAFTPSPLTRANGQIGEKEVMVDDHQVCLFRPATASSHQAGLWRGGQLSPRRKTVGQIQLRAVAYLGAGGPLLNARPVLRFLPNRELRLLQHLFESMEAKVIVSPLEVSRLELQPHLLLEDGNVLEEDLLLQRFGGGGDHHLAAREHRRDQICERLPGPRPCFGEQVTVLGKAFLNRLSHGQLLRSALVAGEHFGEHSGRAQEPLDHQPVFHGSRCATCRNNTTATVMHSRMNMPSATCCHRTARCTSAGSLLNSGEPIVAKRTTSSLPRWAITSPGAIASRNR